MKRIKYKNEIIGIRFNMHDWYVVFRGIYICGTPRSDHDENSEVIWIDVNEAMNRDDVATLTKELIKCAISEKEGLHLAEYESEKHAPVSLYYK